MAARLPLAIFLMGPTAAGKTALALELHARLPVDIISVDAAQVYRGMDIGTAKPTPEEQARAPHRLIDIRDPAETYSAAQFCQDASVEMAAIAGRGRIPLLVGGTMFYFRSLQHGLSDLPSADPALRDALAEEGERLGWPMLHARLARLDPAAAAHIHPHDRQRVQRALEVALLAREHRPPAPSVSLPYRVLKLGIAPMDRALLHARIAVRFQGMLEQGLLSEAEGLYRRGDLSLKLPAMRIVGYRQAWDYLSGEIKYTDMVERGIVATRQLAKRQFTWMRSEADLHWMDSEDADLANASEALIRQNLP